MDIGVIIKNAIIVDGTGAEPFRGNIGISGDVISFIRKDESEGRDYPEASSKEEIVIDAEGMTAVPGFIDAHAHSEFAVLADPRVQGKICQGITTEVNGNCGLSAAPLYREAFERREADLDEYGIKERWNDFETYFRLLQERSPALNFITLTGHGNIRASVMGYKNRAPDFREMLEMQELMRSSIQQGAAGLSTGLIYPPGVYADTDELIKLLHPSCFTLHPGGIYTSHMRSEGDYLIEAVGEVIRIGRESGVAVHISHIKTNGKKNWHKIDKIIAMIEEALGQGIRITCDRYPYVASSTDLDTILPAWTYEGGARTEIDRLKDSGIKELIRQEILKDHPEADYWNNVRLSSINSEKNKWMEGKTIAYIAAEKKLHPVDMLFEILLEEELRAGAIFSSMSEENLKRFLSLPYSMVGTDSSARSFDGVTCRGRPHPRGFGSFPEYFEKYIKDEGLMNLAEAVFRTTLLPARTFGIKNRGMLKKGFYADVVVIDYNKIRACATFDEPFLKPEGIHYVFINGKPVLYEGEVTGLRPGRILKRRKDSL